jgi:drug/metabolite transporter (DMT)-like permease
MNPVAFKRPTLPANWPVHAALISCSLIYSAFFAVIKHLLTEVDEWTFIYIRLTGAAVILAIIEWGFRRTPIQWSVDGARLLGLSLAGVTIVQYLFIFGVHYTSTMHASVIMSSIPVITLCLSVLLGKEAPNGLKITGVLTAFAGVLWLISMRQASVQGQAYPWWGDGLVMLNAMCFSLFLVGMPKLLKTYRPLTVIAYCYIIAAILYNGLGLLGAYPIQWLPQLSPWGWVLATYTVLGASIATYGLNNFALARCKPSTVAMYTFTQPVLASAIGMLWLGEVITVPMVMASGVCLLGLAIANVGRLSSS